MFISDGLNHNWTRPHAQRYTGTYDRTYYTYMGSASSQADLCVRYYDHGSNTLSDEVVVATYGGTDTHGCPSIMVAESGTYAGHIFVFYAYHSTPGYCVRSTAAEEIGSFQAAVQFEDYVTYTNPRQVANGDIWIFYRWSDPTYQAQWSTYPNLPLCYKVSSDGGATWSARTVLVMPIAEPCGFCYAIIRNEGDTIHIAWMSYDGAVALGNYGKGPHHIYTTDKSTWRKSDGTPLSLPISNASAGALYQLGSTEECYLDDLRIDGTGAPHVQFRVHEQGATRSGFYHAHYDGGWQMDAAIPGVVQYGHQTLDPRNPYVSTYALPADTEYPLLLNTANSLVVGELIPDTERGAIWWVENDNDGAVSANYITFPNAGVGDYSTWEATLHRGTMDYPTEALDVYLAPPATGRRRQRIALGGV